MRTTFAGFLAVLVSAVAASAQDAQPPAGPAPELRTTIVARDQNSRTWQRVRVETNRDQIVFRTNVVEELASGMHFWDGSQWVESAPTITITNDGAIASGAPHRVRFAADINTVGAVELTTPDGKSLRTRVMGLAFFDYQSKQSVLIAELTNSIGQLVGETTVVYTNAFSDIKADIRYTYSRAGLEQDIILRERPPLPEDFGLNPDSTRLEIWTEFFDPPEPTRYQRLRKRWIQAKVDYVLDFGAMQIAQGSAFSDGQTGRGRHGLEIDKQWVEVGGRRFLVEDASMRWLVPYIRDLPAPLHASSGRTGPEGSLFVVSTNRAVRSLRVAAAPSHQSIRYASAVAAQPAGAILDYSTLLSSTNKVFKSDTTYYVSGYVSLSGSSNIIEGGTVIKYDVGGEIEVFDTIRCQTGPYRPAVLTCVDDNSVGEAIGTGTPSGYYAAIALLLDNGGTLSYVRVLHAAEAVSSSEAYSVKHSQFVDCGYGLVSDHTSVSAGNILMSHVATNFYGRIYHGEIDNMTTDQSWRLTDDWDFYYYWSCGESTPSSQLYLVNCITSASTNSDGIVPVYRYHSRIYSIGTGVFAVAGAGSYYLISGSTNRAAGTAALDSTLLAELRKKTTWSPVVVSNATLPVATNFGIVALRDTNQSAVDIGWHHDPLDWVFGGVVGSTNVTFSAGTAVGWFESDAGHLFTPGYGLALPEGSTVQFEGTVTAPCVFARYNTVQEAANANWADKSWMGGAILDSSDSSRPAQLIGGFTKFYQLAADPNHFRDWGWFGNCHLRHCEFYSGDLGSDAPPCYFTNCLFHRVYVNMDSYHGPVSFSFECCLFRGGLFTPTRRSFTPQANWVVKDTAFDGTSISIYDILSGDPAYTVLTNNAYLTNGDRMTPTNAHDVLVSDFNWQQGPLGPFYLGTNSPLIDAGNCTADTVGLFHFTSQTNEVKETNSIVNISYHYVALDANGNPFDDDDDGIPDYLQDANGNGVVDNGETRWTSDDPDYDGRNNAQEALDGTDPNDANSVKKVTLGYWKFDTTNFVGDRGQTPIYVSHAETNASWSSNAVHITSASGAGLIYRDVEDDFTANINCRSGTVRFWFKPDWSSTNAGGAGPGRYGTFIDLGYYTSGASYGAWYLSVVPEGDTIGFLSQSNGVNVTHFVFPCSFSSNNWCQIAITYDPQHVALYTNGHILTPGLSLQFPLYVPAAHTNIILASDGVYNFPKESVRKVGFVLGNSWDSGSVGDYSIAGQFENLETFNYPLSPQQIARDFPNFYGTTEDQTLDTDYDGRSDMLERYVDHTGTNDATSAVATKLGFWRFNDSTNAGEMLQMPILATNVSNVTSWSTKSLAISSDSNSRIVYRDVETNGWANFNCQTGAVSFWFKPNWDTNNEPLRAPFVSIGSPSEYWALRTPHDGHTGIGFTIQVAGVTNTHFIAPVDFTSNRWHYIVLNYSTSNVALFVNGSLVTNRSVSISAYPSADSRTNGLVFGNWGWGGGPLNGELEEIETFNYNLTASQITRNFNSVKNVDSDLNGVPDLLEEIVLTTNRPFMGVPFPVTGVIEAELFDLGGQGHGYHTLDTANATNIYRVSNLWITNCDDMGGGYCVDRLRTNEWLKYSIDVRVSGTYTVEPRVAGIGTNGQFKIEFFTNGVMYAWTTNNFVVSTTNWANLTFKSIWLEAGTNSMVVTMLTSGLVAGSDSGAVAKLNYISIYPYWEPWVPTSAVTNAIDLADLLTGSDWHAATNNARVIQNAIDTLPTAQDGVVTIPAGTYYVAQTNIDESTWAFRNSAAVISRGNLEVRGAGKGQTTLVAFDRVTTVFFFAGTYLNGALGRTNFTVHELALEARPHLVSEPDGSGGFINYYEKGAYNPPSSATSQSGSLVSFEGFIGPPRAPTKNILIENCAFIHADRSIAFGPVVTNCVIRSNDFVCWEGTNTSAYTNEQNSPPSPYTTNYPPLSPSIFGGIGGAIITENNYNGNPLLTNTPATWNRYGPDGFVWFQGGGGNWFVARNSITNYDVEAVLLEAGPSAIVQNRYKNFIHTFNASALVYQAAGKGSTDLPADDFFYFVGNVVDGGGEGVLTEGYTTNIRSSKFVASGNTITLVDPYGDSPNMEHPGGGVYIGKCERGFIAGNTLVWGNSGFISGGLSTNVVIFKNDFARSDEAGLCDKSGLYDFTADPSLESIQVIKNTVGQGVGYHLKYVHPDEPRWFLIGNQYRSWTNWTTTTNLLVDPLATYYHLQP